MSFTALFIALLIERFFDCSHLRHWGWYTKYQQFIGQKFQNKPPYLGLAALIIPILIVVMLLVFLTNNMIFGFVKLALSIVIILYCFGPRNLWVDTFACLNAMTEGDAAAANDQLKKSFGIQDQRDQRGLQNIHRQWINAIFIQANSRVFAVVFWFGCAGLVGVMFYRLISLFIIDVKENNQNRAMVNLAQQIKSYLDWPAIRVLTFIFALGGNYSRVLSCWSSKVMLGPAANEELLTECGTAALSHAPTENMALDGSIEKEEISLIDRSVGIVLVVIAVLVLIIP